MQLSSELIAERRAEYETNPRWRDSAFVLALLDERRELLERIRQDELGFTSLDALLDAHKHDCERLRARNAYLEVRCDELGDEAQRYLWRLALLRRRMEAMGLPMEEL